MEALSSRFTVGKMLTQLRGEGMLGIVGGMKGKKGQIGAQIPET